MEFSSQMDALLGLAPGGLPRAFAAWLDRLHPDDRESTVQLVEASVRDGTVYRDEYRLRRDNGTYVDVSDRGVVLKDEGGSSSHMVGAIRDVTHQLEAERALREAAELYRTLFEQAVNPAFQIAEDGRFLDANAAGTRFLETSRPQLLRRDVGRVWGSEALAAVRAATTSGAATSLELELELGGAVKALTVTLVPYRHRGRPRASPWALTSPTTWYVAQSPRGVGGVAAAPSRRPVRQQHRSARDPRAAQPR